MSWSQSFVIGWIQFSIAGLLLLSTARVALRWLPQPAERIRAIQIALAAVMAVPLLLALAPLPAWRLGLVSPSAEEHTADGGTGQSALPLESSALMASHDAALAPQDPLTAENSEPRALAGESPVPAAEVPTTAVSPVAATASADPWKVAALVIGLAHGIAIAFLLIEWGVGIVRLRRLQRSAIAAPRAIVAVWETVSAHRRHNARILISSEISTPLTFGWQNPVVVIPCELASPDCPALRSCLSHECSHIERGDMLAWRGVWACQFLLWYQPLFWTLRRELRICQDVLADHRSLRTGSDAIEYSELLVALARRHRTPALAGALTFIDHPSQLSRRVKMLLEFHAPLRSVCTWRFSLLATTAAIMSAALVTGVRLDAAPESVNRPRDADQAAALQPLALVQQSEQKEKPAQTEQKPAPPAEKLTYHCIVVDKETGKGIPDARVKVRRSLLSSLENRIIEESRHTTDAEGKYTVEIPPEQVAERYLYIELDVEHDEYAGRKGFGYALSMIRKNETLGERPFFERTELPAGAVVQGRVLSPDGAPAAGVKVQGFSMASGRDFRGYFSFVDTLTGADGKFRLALVKDGEAVLWIIPRDFAIIQKFVAKERGEMGEFRLQQGVRTGGRVLSADGKPLAGVAVNIDYRGDRDVGGLPVATSIRRGAISDGEGRFQFDPLPAGEYRVIPEEHLSDPLGHDRTVYDVPGVFVGRKVTLKEGVAAPVLEVQAVPHVLFNAQVVDSKGAKTAGHAFHLHGKIDGDYWFGQGRPDKQGTISLRVPHGLQEVGVQLSTNEHGALRYRRTKDGPLENDTRSISFGTLNDDVNGFEIVRYRAPLVVIAAVDEDQKPIKTFKVAGTYPWGKQEYVSEGEQRSDLHFEHQDDGRFRTSQMLPDEEVTFTVTSPGYQPATEKVKLPEGESKELVLTLKKATEEKTP